MTDQFQQDLRNIAKLGRFVTEYASKKFPAIEFPWSVGNCLFATDGVWLVWLKSEIKMLPVGTSPPVEQTIDPVLKLSETDWKKFTLDNVACESCGDEVVDVDDACDACKVSVLGKPFSLKRVNAIAETFDVQGVAIVSETTLAFRLKDGYAVLCGLIGV